MAVSAASFVFFGLACIISKELLSEFSRYGLSKWRTTAGTFQLLGAAGLTAGIWIPWAGMVASGGLAVMMLLGVAVRVKIRDSVLQTVPAFAYMLLNGWIFIRLMAD